jgi:nucleotide-binding universal stress UspA family protein
LAGRSAAGPLSGSLHPAEQCEILRKKPENPNSLTLGGNMSIINQIRKIVTPVDFSDNSRLIAESAAYMAGRFGAAMHLIFVVQNFEDYSGFFVPQMTLPTLEGELVDSAEAKMKSFCGELVSFCESVGVKDLTYKVFMGDVAEKIVEYAEEVGADMIVMGTHGYKGLEKIMFGSVAGKVVRSASCPVLTINPYTCCR